MILLQKIHFAEPTRADRRKLRGRRWAILIDPKTTRALESSKHVRYRLRGLRRRADLLPGRFNVERFL